MEFSGIPGIFMERWCFVGKGGLYKACVIWEKDMWYLFYNAKNKENGNWNEQIGVAFSKDLLHWERYAGNPVLRNGKNKWDCTFVADPYVVKDGDIWLCFYYGIGLMDPEDDFVSCGRWTCNI